MTKTTIQIKKMQHTENDRLWYSQNEVDNQYREMEVHFSIRLLQLQKELDKIFHTLILSTTIKENVSLYSKITDENVEKYLQDFNKIFAKYLSSIPTNLVDNSNSLVIPKSQSNSDGHLLKENDKLSNPDNRKSLSKFSSKSGNDTLTIHSHKTMKELRQELRKNNLLFG